MITTLKKVLCVKLSYMESDKSKNSLLYRKNLLFALESKKIRYKKIRYKKVHFIYADFTYLLRITLYNLIINKIRLIKGFFHMLKSVLH